MIAHGGAHDQHVLAVLGSRSRGAALSRLLRRSRLARDPGTGSHTPSAGPGAASNDRLCQDAADQILCT